LSAACGYLNRSRWEDAPGIESVNLPREPPTLANDSADGGVSFCPLDSYLLIGGAGFALGFTIGWVV